MECVQLKSFCLHVSSLLLQASFARLTRTTWSVFNFCHLVCMSPLFCFKPFTPASQGQLGVCSTKVHLSAYLFSSVSSLFRPPHKDNLGCVQLKYICLLISFLLFQASFARLTRTTWGVFYECTLVRSSVLFSFKPLSPAWDNLGYIHLKFICLIITAFLFQAIFTHLTRTTRGVFNLNILVTASFLFSSKPLTPN